MLAKNPAGILPQAIEDRIYGYSCFRNRWKAADDIVVAAFLGYSPIDAYKSKFRLIVVWGLGNRYEFGNLTAKKPAECTAKPDGSGIITAGAKHLAVDFSGASGAPLSLIEVGIGEGKSDAHRRFVNIIANGQVISVFTLSQERHPEVKIEEKQLRIGGQRLLFNGKKLSLGKSPDRMEPCSK